jgi:hypothetical protein
LAYEILTIKCEEWQRLLRSASSEEF